MKEKGRLPNEDKEEAKIHGIAAETVDARSDHDSSRFRCDRIDCCIGSAKAKTPAKLSLTNTAEHNGDGNTPWQGHGERRIGRGEPHQSGEQTRTRRVVP